MKSSLSRYLCPRRADLWGVLGLLTVVLLSSPWAMSAGRVFPGETWETVSPESQGVDAGQAREIAGLLGGRGCIIKDGYVVESGGDQGEIGDWFSSAKPVLSTLLFFAIEEGLVREVDQPLLEFGWDLRPKDHGITFRQLGAMRSGYARPEGAG